MNIYVSCLPIENDGREEETEKWLRWDDGMRRFEVQTI